MSQKLKILMRRNRYKDILEIKAGVLNEISKQKLQKYHNPCLTNPFIQLITYCYYIYCFIFPKFIMLIRKTRCKDILEIKAAVLNEILKQELENYCECLLLVLKVLLISKLAALFGIFSKSDLRKNDSRVLVLE